MSLFHFGAFSRLGTKLGDLRHHWASRARRRGNSLSFRRLCMDPLEERALLSVSPLDPKSIVVNQVYGVKQETTPGRSVAVADNGDFVVAWTRWDKLVDASGNPIIDPLTGVQKVDANIYARYFTDEVQRVTLPLGIIHDVDDDPNTTGHFSLKYNAQSIQDIQITAGVAPVNDPDPPVSDKIHGTFTLWFDANRNSTVSTRARRS